jgi:hypothetical protein
MVSKPVWRLSCATRAGLWVSLSSTLYPQDGDIMRKMIMMAIAGFLLKKVQAKYMKQTYQGNPVRRV